MFLVLVVTSQGRDIIPLEKWRFFLGEVSGAERIDFNDSSWENVEVPHDWAIDKHFDMRIDIQTVQVLEDGETRPMRRTGRTGALPTFGVGYYRTKVVSDNSMRNKKIRIEFDGAMSLSKVFLNGKFIGEWPYGYSSFAFDLTEHWNYDGDNIVTVRLENEPESSRWYSGAGIYRNVRIVALNDVSVAHWGTNVTTPVIKRNYAEVNVVTDIDNYSNTADVMLESIIYDMDDKIVAKRKSSKKITKNDNQFVHNLKVSKPILWDIDNPYMYKLVSNVYSGGVLKDSYTTNIGIRSIRYDKDNGFFLNGKHVKIKGVCLHHDLGPLGAAVNYRALERQLQMMKEMGCNAIRTSHNPPTPELLDLCDQMGLLVQVEAFDEWKVGKNKNGYNKYFDEWAERDLVAMIRRDRNHPSVIMWSIGNEIREQKEKKGAETARFLTQICHREDPTRPVTAGFNSHTSAIKNGLADEIDLVGFNYKPKDYKKKHEEFPDYIIYGSETASTVSSRGVYKFPVKEIRDVYYHDYHVSSYDLEYPAWASTPDTEFEQQDDCDFIMGEFVWTGFDYLGEPTPFNEGTPARSSYFGIVDLAGLKKDRYYLYKSKWSLNPVLHLLPHWNWNDRIGQNVPVFCYTNYPKAELFVNGKSKGIKQKNKSNKYERYRLMWNDVVYYPGEIKVVAYDENNIIKDSVLIKTAGDPYQITAYADRNKIVANGKDLSFVTVEIKDKEGNLCPLANNLLFFDVDGTTELEAVCNGDPTDHTPFSSDYMRTFNGKLVVILRSSESKGNSVLKVYGSNLKSAEVELSTY